MEYTNFNPNCILSSYRNLSIDSFQWLENRYEAFSSADQDQYISSSLPLAMTNTDYMVWTYRISSQYLWSWIENRLANKSTLNIRIGYYNNYRDSSGNYDIDCGPATIKVFILGWI